MNTFLLMLFTIFVVWFVVLYAYWFAIPAFGRWLMKQTTHNRTGAKEIER